ncbi:MAG: homoserine dehydrogenase [Clostridiales bacterium]|nr:homoserine dehydrogenase [Clostridiales bacterium]
MFVAVMGYGTVGSGVVELLYKNHDSIVKKSMQESLELKYILDLRDFPDSPYQDKFIKDFNIILNDPEVKIVVETMGGITFAYDYVKKLLLSGKSVVTSNKELVAEKGYELLCIAKEKNVNFLFEASVGGGIPIIRPITQCLAANEIDEIAGILNGTTNYILTKMITEQASFEDALKNAQALGYAEKDPTADVEGDDSCRKICILASLCFGKHVYPKDVHTEGITKISLSDVAYANSWGGVIKLIAAAKRLDNGKITVTVGPAFVQNHSQLANVDDVFNAILVRGDAIGDVVFYGRGAGKMPTASAVVADVIDAAKHTLKKKNFGWDNAEENYVIDYREQTAALYVRGETDDKEGVIKLLNGEIGAVRVLSLEGAPENELAIITNPATEGELRDKIENIPGFTPKSVIRITDY